MKKSNIVKTKLGIFLSWDEFYFASWCEEVKQAGFIKKWNYEPYPIILSEGMTNKYTYTKILKTKERVVEEEQVILRPSSYTPDFLIIWNEKAQRIFYDLLNGGLKIERPFISHCDDDVTFSLAEIKPVYDLHGKTRKFIDNHQKIVWERFEKFVNLIKIEELFKETFTPAAYLKTPKGGKRKPKWKVKTLKQFLN